MKKERRRNAVPAWLGIYAIAIFFFNLVLHLIVNGLKNDVDGSIRAFVIAISSDVYFCIIAPFCMLYAVPSITKKLFSKGNQVEPFHAEQKSTRIM